MDALLGGNHVDGLVVVYPERLSPRAALQAAVAELERWLR
ncbi:hypothetical protein JOD67_006924 [Tenggerimyces flavus]|nr:hypothetical protein [Tenggerimyces flavus]